MRPGLTLSRFLIVFLFVMAVWVAWYSYMRPTGYCPSTSRYVSDDEMFVSAVARRAQDVRGLPENPSSRDLETFIKQNQDCCVVMRGGPFPEGVLDRLFSSGKWIHVLHELKSEVIHKSQPDDVACEAFVKVDGCGRARDYYGIPITRKEMLEKKLANKSAK
jgi:hypothetical protein